MYQLLKDKKIIWTTETILIFGDIRDLLIKDPIIHIPNYKKRFYLYTDACNLGLGAVLCQINDKNEEKVIIYASRMCNSTKRNIQHMI